MKKTTLLKSALLSVAIGSMSLTATSCKQEPKAEDTKEVAEDQNEAKFDDTNEAKEDDSQYLVAAAEVDMAEIELSKLAETKSTDADVKSLAKMMIDAHTKASAALKELADKKQISLPAALTEDGKEKYEDLNKKSGKDFDQKFADLMVDGHKDAISKLEKASEKATDPEIKTWATNMLPTLQAHLQHAETLKDKIKNKK